MRELQIVVTKEGRFRVGQRNASDMTGFFAHFAHGRVVKEVPASLAKDASEGWAVQELDVREGAIRVDVSGEVEALLEVAAELMASALEKLNGG